MTLAFAGLDIGTTWIKVVVIDGDGTEQVVEYAPTPWEAVPTGAELDPDELIASCYEVLDGAIRSRAIQVGAIGVTGMAEAGVLLQRTTVASPCIAWFDRRGDEGAARIRGELGETFTLRTGLPASRLCSLAKLLWMVEGYGELPGSRWLDLPAFVAYHLSGVEGAEASLASRTGLFDVRAGKPFEPALDLLGADSDLMPRLIGSGEPWGEINEGPVRSVLVTVAGHDDPVAAIGAGALEPGDVFDSCGTAEAYLRAIPDDLSDDDVAGLVEGGCTVGVLPGGGLRALGGFEAGRIVADWERRLVPDGDVSTIDELAAELPRGAGGVTVRDLWGEPQVLGQDPRPEQIYRALFEAIADRGQQSLAAMERVAGPPRRFVVSGGGAQAATVKAVKSERFKNLKTPDVSEAAARGAAIAAGVAAGAWASFADAPRPRLHDYG